MTLNTHKTVPRNKAIVLYWGDWRDFNSWSGVHYHLARAFELKFKQVIHVDMSRPHWLTMGYDLTVARIFRRLMRLFARNSVHRYMHTPISRWRVRRMLKNLSRKHPDTNLLFITNLFTNGKGLFRCPVINYSDQCALQVLENTSSLPPSVFDMALIRRETVTLNCSDAIVLTNRAANDFLISRYPLKVRSVAISGGLNLPVEAVDVNKLIAQKKQSRSLLFIGRGYHKRGVDILLEAFYIFNSRQSHRFKLNIVGLNKKELDSSNPDVIAHGFLDKAKPNEWNQLRNLMAGARLFIMPSRTGPPAGATAEAMFYATPPLLSAAVAGAATIENNAGWRVENMDPNAWANKIEEAITHADYEETCHKAHNLAVAKKSWEGFVERVYQALGWQA